MSITKIEKNTYKTTQNQAFKTFSPKLNTNFYSNSQPEKNTNNTKLKLGVISATILSTLAVLYGITKQRGLNPLKNFNMFRQEIEPMDMLKITGVNIPVSLLVGSALDKKENKKNKIKEGIYQMIGNLLTPILTIEAALKLRKKINSKTFKNPIMKTIQKSHKALYTAVSLVGGLILGNKIANKTNDTLFNDYKKRPLKIQDFFIHFDDLCFATSLIFKGQKLGKFASRVIPLTLLMSAYQTGIKNSDEPKK